MDKEVQDIMSSINKEMKTPAIRVGDVCSDVEVFSSGSIALDKAIGVGGIPIGRIIEIYGPESSGKTTITLTAIACAQKFGYVCAFLDMEHALDRKLAVGCGVNWDRLLFSQPDYAEQCLGIAEKLVLTGKVKLVVIDSVAAMVPKAELDGDMEDQQMGLQARILGKGLRKLASVCSKHKCTIIFINQLREKIGQMYGNPEVTPGGRSLKFTCSLRMDVRRRDKIERNGMQIGNALKIKIVKNKVAPPHAEAEIDLIFGKGVDNTKDIVQMAVDYGICGKKGSGWFNYKEIKSNGMSNFVNDLISGGFIVEIEDEVRIKMKNNIIIDAAVSIDEEDEFDETAQ